MLLQTVAPSIKGSLNNVTYNRDHTLNMNFACLAAQWAAGKAMTLGIQEQIVLAVEGKQRVMNGDDLIVSKTNLKGHLLYANDVFLDIADLTLDETIGQPHSIIRSKAMPRCIFKLLWDRVQSGQEIFAYVVNTTKFGDHYWVFAHVTVSRDAAGNINGYHSNRRKPKPAAIAEISGLYEELLAAENSIKNAKKGMEAGYALLLAKMNEKGVDYDEYVFSL